MAPAGMVGVPKSRVITIINTNIQEAGDINTSIVNSVNNAITEGTIVAGGVTTYSKTVTPSDAAGVLTTINGVKMFLCTYKSDADWDGDVWLEYQDVTGAWVAIMTMNGGSSTAVANDLGQGSPGSFGNWIDTFGAGRTEVPFNLRLRVDTQASLGSLEVKLHYFT